MQIEVKSTRKALKSSSVIVEISKHLGMASVERTSASDRRILRLVVLQHERIFDERGRRGSTELDADKTDHERHITHLVFNPLFWWFFMPFYRLVGWAM